MRREEGEQCRSKRHCSSVLFFFFKKRKCNLEEPKNRLWHFSWWHIVCLWQQFSLSSVGLFFSLLHRKSQFTFFVDILTSIFIILIFYFCSWLFFVEVLYFFLILSFNPNLLYIIVFNLVLILRNIFLDLLLNWFFFSISPSINNLFFFSFILFILILFIDFLVLLFN